MSIAGVLDTSIGSANLGDHIIMEACMDVLRESLPTTHFMHFSSHASMGIKALRLQRRVALNFLCGTNCISSHMLFRSSWGISLLTALLMKPVVTIGVGWAQYQGDPDLYTRQLLRASLLHDGILSVRDDYTRAKLEGCGFSNVVNTGCPSMWGLTPEHCRRVSRRKADKVVCTLTDYAPDEALDAEMLVAVHESYQDVFFWPQGSRDVGYLERLRARYSGLRRLKIRLIPPSVGALDAFLRQHGADYLGTRLHAGIRALQHGRRTIIVGVDNRALEKKRDFSLPVVERGDQESLGQLIGSAWPTRINLPAAGIARFRSYLETSLATEDASLPFVET